MARQERFVLSVLMICVVVPVLGQGGSAQQGSVAEGSVYVWNSDQRLSVMFGLGGDGCDPITDTLNPDSYDTFTCQDAEYFTIVIVTSRNGASDYTVSRRLMAAHRYRLYVNSATDAWDVAEILGR